MKRQQRLREQARFRQVREEGRSWAHPLLVLCALPNDLPYSRFGFTASRYVGKAAARNRARRLLREAVRLHLQEIEAGWDMVFIARAAIAEASFQEVTAACMLMLQRAGLWRGEQ
ncbi:MAG: ribonuclease P protein component [Anaerolineae bacterium]|nr:ribonuclease P protein component [Anaerolineae bacterium]